MASMLLAKTLGPVKPTSVPIEPVDDRLVQVTVFKLLVPDDCVILPPVLRLSTVVALRVAVPADWVILPLEVKLVTVRLEVPADVVEYWISLFVVS